MTDTVPRPTGFSTTGVLDKPRRAAPSDWLTVASLAVLAYAAANLLHEGLGHGGACVLVGGTPQLLTSVSFDCDTGPLPNTAARIVSASGTIVNLMAGALAVLAYRRARGRTPAARFFLWLLATVNLLQAFGYFLFSGLGRVGDWAAVMAGIHPAWMWRIGLAAGGGALYWVATRRAFAALAGFVGGDPSDRLAAGTRLSLIVYGSGAALYCLSGLFNPLGPLLLLISAAAASLGGTSGLWWGTNFLRGEGNAAASTGVPARMARDPRLIAAAAAAALVFVVVLGPGIRL